MRVKILDAPVRQNIEIFLDNLRHIHEPLPTKKIFDAWLNRDTGQILFVEPSKESLMLAKDEWKPVAVSYAYDRKKGEIVFLIEDRMAKVQGFRGDDVSRIAYQVVARTMKMLSSIAEKLKGPSDFATKMQVLVKIEVQGEISHEDRNIVIEAWHPVDRMGAEAILKDMPVGTFIFRCDTFSEVLEQQLHEQLKVPLKCFIATFLQPNQQVGDLTVVHYDGKWLFYDDDPSLKEPAYEDLNALLATKKEKLKFPLYHS